MTQGGIPMDRSDAQFFDRKSSFAIKERRLPHWSQAGTVCFLTWRTADSLPKAVLQRWQAERMQLLRAAGIDAAKDVRSQINELDTDIAKQVRRQLFQSWDRYLDQAHGECLLKRPELASLVAESLMFFDGDRYVLYDYVIMPNHVHLLAAFDTDERMVAQARSWKRFTAGQINKRLGLTGSFWQTDTFDHLVRDEEAFRGLQQYIAQNPINAGLQPHEFLLHGAR